MSVCVCMRECACYVGACVRESVRYGEVWYVCVRVCIICGYVIVFSVVCVCEYVWVGMYECVCVCMPYVL